MGKLATAQRRLVQPLWNALQVALDPRHSVILCVSGGPDSRALLEAVARWPARGSSTGTITVATVDHRTRPESAAEARAVAARAIALGFDVDVVTLAAAHAQSGEATLRDARYRALGDVARTRNATSLVTAHHAGDDAEGALLSWLGQGGGRDAAAMDDVAPAPAADRPPRHDSGGREARPSIPSLLVVRPFLGLSRDALRVALFACGVVDVFADPDVRSQRAQLRRRVLGPLGDERHDLEDRLATLARRRRDDERVLASNAADLVAPDGTIRKGPIALMRRALMEAVRRNAPQRDPRDASRGVEVALGLVRSGRSGHVDLSGATLDVDLAGVVTVAATPTATHDVGSRVDTSTDILGLDGSPPLATLKRE